MKTNKSLLLPSLLMILLVGCSSQAPERVSNGVPDGVTGGMPAINSVSTGPKAKVQVSLSDGPGISALINKNYNEDTTSCTEYGTGKARGYYFCTGVLLRTTDNGNFNPWESSPTALQLRATSYAWIRHDLNTSSLYKGAGFILLSPADILAEAVPGLDFLRRGGLGATAVQCVYPFDAWTTRTMDRGRFGCDEEGTGLGSTDPYNSYGSCDNKLGFTTAQQWNTHFQSVGQTYHRQCSWNADNAQGWRNMIASHNSFPGRVYWNEVMLFNWGPTAEAGATAANEMMRRWTVAYFYDQAVAGSLATAKVFQQKMAATGKRVPILRLNFTAAAASRFEFRAADQFAGAYP